MRQTKIHLKNETKNFYCLSLRSIQNQQQADKSANQFCCRRVSHDQHPRLHVSCSGVSAGGCPRGHPVRELDTLTAKHACPLRMWLCMKGHGAWLYGVHRTCAETAAVSCGTSHASTVSTPLRWIFQKCAIKSYSLVWNHMRVQ